jgi:hypothetical protein
MFLILIVSGCATGSYVPPPPATVTVNTMPSGADISIDENYIGKSPVVVNISQNRRGDAPMKIEASLDGFETKNVTFGDYHPPEDEVLTKIVETASTIQRVFAGTKTIPAYYTFREGINIKLNPRR